MTIYIFLSQFITYLSAWILCLSFFYALVNFFFFAHPYIQRACQWFIQFFSSVFEYVCRSIKVLHIRLNCKFLNLLFFCIFYAGFN